nr:BrnT family toxin [uncultured Rhodopila sp.]
MAEGQGTFEVRKHGVDFSLAEDVFADPFAETLWDGFVNGEERGASSARSPQAMVSRLFQGYGTCLHLPEPV